MKRQWRTPSEPTCIAVDGRGLVFVSYKKDWRIDVFGRAAGDQRSLELRTGHSLMPYPLWAMAFSPDGALCAGGERQVKVLFWFVFLHQVLCAAF